MRTSLRFRRTGLVLVGLLLATLATEVAVRFTSPPSARVLRLFEPRPSGSSYQLKRNLDFRTPVGGRSIHIFTNSRGFAGPEVDPHKRPGVVRVAVLGDSFTFGQWADDYPHAFVGQTREQLGDEPIELVSFGVPGYGYEDIRLCLEEDALPLDPDVVILCTFNGNDFRETWLGPDRERVVDGVLEPDEECYRTRVPAEFYREPDSFDDRWLERSALYRVLRARWKRAFDPPTPTRTVEELLQADSQFQSSPFWSRTDAPPIALEAARYAQGLIEQMHQRCLAAGVHFAVVSIPYKLQVQSEAIEGDGYDLRYPQRWVEEACVEHSIPYLDTFDALRKLEHVDKVELYTSYDSHFSNVGHAAFGRLLAPFVIEQAKLAR